MSNINERIKNFKSDISDMRKEIKNIKEVLMQQNEPILSLLSSQLGTTVPKDEPESDTPDFSDNSNISQFTPPFPLTNFEYLNEFEMEINDNKTNVLPCRQIPNDHSQEKLAYLPQSVNSKCPGCAELSRQFDLYKDAAEKRHNILLDILAEHKVLLDRIAKQYTVATNLIEFFPINTVEKLKEFDAVLATHADPYLRQIKSLLAGNAESNLHEVFGQSIIMDFNVDGTFGKKRLRDFPNVFKAVIDVISTFNEFSDKTLRAAFQRQKKKYFKQLGRCKSKTNEKPGFEDGSSNKED